MEQWDEGVFFIKPPGASETAPLILSSGIHGDETLPVEVLEELWNEIHDGRLHVVRPCLLIFANAQALANQRRFMKHNLNRLFGVRFPPPGYEGRRARELEGCCRDMHEMFGTGWHLDLHSTIKPSLYPSFALQPAGPTDYGTRWLPTLARAGISALVRQRTASHTFSHFTANDLGYESFTLECGAVGNHGGAQSAALAALVRGLLTKTELETGTATTVRQFDVAMELIKADQDFRFLVDEAAPNFESYGLGVPIAVNNGCEVHSPVADCAVLFANSGVPVGDRAALLLEPVTPPAP